VRRSLAGRGTSLEIPASEPAAFAELSVSRMLRQIDAILDGEEAVPSDPAWAVHRLGCGLPCAPDGRALSSCWARLDPCRGAGSSWTGAMSCDLARPGRSTPFDHHAWVRKGAALDSGFSDDAERYEPFPLPDAPTLVLQGNRDEVVAPELASEFVQRNARARARGTPGPARRRPRADRRLPRLWREIEGHLANANADDTRRG